MKNFKEIVFAASLAFAAAIAFTHANAHEIRFGNLVIHHPWSRQTPAGAKVAIGFMTITNNGKEDDRLIGATAEISETAQIHDMKMEGDVMKMPELPDGVIIPAGGSVLLKPRSMHIMFMGLKTLVHEGETFSGTLTFEKTGTIEVDYEVKGMTATTH